MDVTITYRHNAMDITSLDAFFSIRGGFHEQIREVYFVRALGECAGFSEKLGAIERRMEAESLRGRLVYVRIGALPNIGGEDAVRICSEAYDRWKQGQALTLPQTKENPLLGRAVSDALLRAEGLYRDLKKNVSESMERNFGIKLLFWLEEKAGPCLEGWKENSCSKVVLENVGKEQEYLFGYFLSLLGCDVLLLQNRRDAEVPEALKRLSKPLVLGAFGKEKLPPYVPPAPEAGQGSAAPERRNSGTMGTGKAGAAETEAARKGAVKVVIPERVRKGRPGAAAPEAGRPAAREAAERGAEKRETRTEKTFEELARMASSIVMITVHDRAGEVLGTGSGIMIGRDGYILTNHHVAAGGCFYSVRIEDDEEIYRTDEIIKYNQALDLAVLRIGRVLKPLSVYRGPEKLVRGQRVVAIGSPLGLFNSVSDGIISGFRNIRDTDMIQFTAPISPGSSGGAVLNMYGEVIGISTAGIDNGQNINLAVGYESIRMFAGGFLGRA